MAYCTTAELVELTGSTLDASTVLTPIISQADREIDAYLAYKGQTGTAGNAHLKTASLNLSIVGIITRTSMDGTRPANISLGGKISLSNNIVGEIKELKDRAYSAIESFISQTQTTAGTKHYFKRANT